MSNEQELIISGNGPMQLPAHLQGIEVGVSKALLAGMFQGGNRIGLKGSRFRLVVNGIEEGVFEENYLDTILVSAAPAVSRSYYKNAYKQGENQPPTCYSADGVVPNDDVKHKQSDKCMTCPQNVKGSKIADGQMYKACGFFRRLVAFLAGDTVERRVYKLDVKSHGLWGDNSPNAKNLNDYIKMMESRGIDVGHVVTRMSFDTNSSTPKLLFRPHRYITAEELEALKDLIVSDEVKKMAEVSMATLDLSGEEPTEGDTPEGTAQEAPQAQQAQTATPTAQRPVQQRPAQQAKPAVAVEDVPAEAAPAQQTPKPVQTQRPTPTQQRPVQQTPVQQRPVQQATQQPVQQQPVVQEVNNNDELAGILDGLED